MGEAKIPLPGGCNIGARPVDEHINALKALGAEVEVHNDVDKAKSDAATQWPLNKLAPLLIELKKIHNSLR